MNFFDEEEQIPLQPEVEFQPMDEDLEWEESLFNGGFNDTDLSDQWDPLSYLPTVMKERVPYIDCTGIPTQPGFQVKGMEVGDDRVDVCLCKEHLERMLHAQESIFRMKTSVNDTVISTEVFNFCEVTSVAPRDETCSYLQCKVQNRMQDIEFCDVPPLRVILPVTKGPATDVKKSIAGKVRELAMQTNSCSKHAQFEVNLASFIQDALLNVVRHCPEPKYLPRFMGGCGCQALFNNHRNIYLSTVMYKVTGFSRLYGSATREAKEVLQTLSVGKTPRYPVLCNALRLGRDYLLGTYDEKVIIPQEVLHGNNLKDLSPVKILYTGGRQDPSINVVENRLLRCKLICTKTDAITEQNKAKRIFDLILQLRTGFSEAVGRIKNESVERRKRFDDALTANQALQRLIARRANKEDIFKAAAGITNVVRYDISYSGEREFTLEHASFIHSGHRTLVAAMYCFPRSEDIYVKEEVSMDLLMKVPGIPLAVTQGSVKIRETVSRAGLWEISGTMYDWANRKLEELLDQPRPIPSEFLRGICLKDREWVNDDTLILGDVLRSEIPSHSSIALISKDAKLADRIAKQCTVKVLLIPPEIYLFRTNGINVESELTPTEISELIQIPPTVGRIIKVYLDSGSARATLARFVESGQVRTSKFCWEPLSGTRELTPVRFQTQHVRRLFEVRDIRTRLFIPIAGSLSLQKGFSGM